MIISIQGWQVSILYLKLGIVNISFSYIYLTVKKEMTTKSISTSYLANYITKLLHNVLLLNEIIFVLKVLKITQILTVTVM